MDNLMLSIYIPTYNHQAYIEEALDSVLMQKTDYKFEVLVGEDCSTDETRNVLKQYEKKHPNKIKVFYRERNLNKEKIRNSADLRMRCKGKYIIGLEGDDFWTDPLKIQKQIEFLEKNPDFIAVSHRCKVVGKDSQSIDEKYPECKDRIYTLKHLVSEIMPGQLTTIMYRNPNYMDENIKNIMYKNIVPGDRAIYFALASQGKIYCMPEVMSAYRHIKSGGSSFSANYNLDFDREQKWAYEIYCFAKSTNNTQAIEYSRLLYFRYLAIELKSKKSKKICVIKKMKNVNAGVKTIALYLKAWVKNHILNEKIWV